MRPISKAQPPIHFPGRGIRTIAGNRQIYLNLTQMLASAPARCFSGDAIALGSFKFQNVAAVESTLARLRGEDAAIALLKLAQEENGGFLNTGCIDVVAALTKTPATAIQAKLQWLLYPKFELTRRARHTIECCAGAACRVGGTCVQSVIEKYAKGTFRDRYTPDGEFELVQSQCYGGCYNGPWMKVDGYLFVRLTEKDIERVIERAARGDYAKMFVYVKEPSEK
jgi:NADH:ubiquinone oxidoreductase subunit E